MIRRHLMLECGSRLGGSPPLDSTFIVPRSPHAALSTRAALDGNDVVVTFSLTSPRCRAFLVREQQTGRGLDAAHWELHNKSMFQFLETEEAKKNSVAAFEKDGSTRGVDPALTNMADDTE